MSTPVAGLRGVTLAYGSKTVLRDVSVDVGTGLTFLVGENGVGKTTIFKALLGQIRPKAGQVSRNGQSVTRRTRAAALQGTGYLPQSFSFPGHMKVLDLVRYAGWLRGIPASEVSTRAQVALERVSLSGEASSRMRELSGGMARRAGIAQALVHEPDLLLLDEPTVGLDPRRRVELRELLSTLARDVAIVTSTHLLDDVQFSGGDVIVLGNGGIQFRGRTEDFLAASADGADRPFASPLESAMLRLLDEGRD